MNDEFELPVDYKGEQVMLKASFLVTGFTHKFIVDVKGQDIIFEPDDERNYRAIILNENINKNIDMDKGFLKAIAKSIEEILK